MSRSPQSHENSSFAGRGGFSRRTLLRGGASVAAAGAFSAFLAACGSSSSSSASPAASAAGPASGSGTASLGSVALQLGWIPGAGYSGSFIADSKGYYKSHGADVTIKPGGPSVSGMPLLISDKVQVAISDPQTTASAITQGGDVKVIAAGYQVNPACIMSLTATGIKTPADLKGKTIGVGASDDSEWYAFLAANNISKSEVTTVPASFDTTPVIEGKWDGYLAFSNNEVPQLQAKGLKISALMFADFGLPSYNDIYVVTTAALGDSAKRKALAAFLAGEIQGWTTAVGNAKLGAQLVVDDYGKNEGYTLAGQTLASAATNAIAQSADTKANGLLHMSQQGIENTIKTMASTGVKGSASMFDTSLWTEAYAMVKSS